MRRLRDERGAALVEAPFAIAIILLISMGVLTITQVAWNHLDLANTVRDASRYASRAEWDPSASTVTPARYRTVGEIKDFATRAGSESGVTDDSVVVDVVRNGVKVTPAPSDSFVLQLGDQVTVQIKNTVSNPLYKTAASVTNAVTGIFPIGHVFDEDGVQITASSSTFVE